MAEGAEESSSFLFMTWKSLEKSHLFIKERKQFECSVHLDNSEKKGQGIPKLIHKKLTNSWRTCKSPTNAKIMPLFERFDAD